MKTTASLVKIFLSTRNDDDIELEFNHEPNISIQVPDNSTSIELYVHPEVQRCIEKKRLRRGWVDDTLKELVVSSLIKTLGGMYGS